MTRAAAFIVAAALTGSVASAQDIPMPGDERPAAEAAGQRFRFSPVTDGVLRLDTQTGEVSFCSARQVGWACQAAPDDRAALDTEIARLQSQVDALSKEVAGLRAASAAVPRPPETVPPSKNGELKLPNRADLERAKAFIDDAWRRLVEMLEQWRKDMQRT